MWHIWLKELLNKTSFLYKVVWLTGHDTLNACGVVRAKKESRSAFTDFCIWRGDKTELTTFIVWTRIYSKATWFLLRVVRKKGTYMFYITCMHFFISISLPTRRYASAGLCDINVSLRPSVTRRYCVKTNKASVMISSLSGSAKILVFWCKISSRYSKRFPRAGASNKGGVGKISSFLSLSPNISKTVGDAAEVTMSNRKSHMGFPSTPRSMTFDELELL